MALLIIFSYFVTDYMDTTLAQVLETKRLDENFAKYFLFQILSGLKVSLHMLGLFIDCCIY